MKLQDYVDLLGYRVRDKVTGFEGVVTSIGFDLYGCVQAVVTPASKDGKQEDSRWYDTHRLAIQDGERVMALPCYASLVPQVPRSEPKGPADKPSNSRY